MNKNHAPLSSSLWEGGKRDPGLSVIVSRGARGFSHKTYLTMMKGPREGERHKVQRSKKLKLYETDVSVA